MYRAILLAILATQTFAIFISRSYAEATRTMAGIGCIIFTTATWICAYNAQEKYDDYENKSTILKKKLKN